MSWPWSQLGLPGPAGLSEVRRAYAEKLKTAHPEEDPEGFQRLHAAYQAASRMARQRERQERARPAPPPRPAPERETPIPPTGEGEELWHVIPPLEGDDGPSGGDREEEIDFDELIRTGEEDPRPPDGGDGEQEQDLDFDELIQTGEEDPRPPDSRDGERERDFDFDRLLEQEVPPVRPPEQGERDFDFERLFAEGDAERAEARRRRAEERRRAQAQAKAQERERQKAREWTQKRERWQRREQQNAYDRERRQQFDQEQAQWQSTEILLHTMEMLHSSQAGREAWQKLFRSALFRQSRGSLDLLFGLEDLVSDHPDLSREIRLELFRAFGFETGEVRPEQQTLYRMLLPSWKAEQKERRRYRWCQVGSALGSVALIFLIVSIFLSSYLPLYILIGAAALYGLKEGWLGRGPEVLDRARRTNMVLFWLLALGIFTFLCYMMDLDMKIPLYLLGLGGALWALQGLARLSARKEQIGGRSGTRRRERQTAVFAAACAAVLVAVLLILPEVDRDRAPPSGQDQREQVCRYLEEDFGVPFRSLYGQRRQERYSNVFALESDPEKMFLAGPAAERDLEAGERGYTTNYPGMMVLWALEGFAAEHGLEHLDQLDREQGAEAWDTLGTYLIELPFYGAGETITDLEALLKELAQADWYQLQPPGFALILCSEEMGEGRLILYDGRQSPGEMPDGRALRAMYEESFGHACCAQLLQENDLDRDFPGGGTEPYTLTNGGIAELAGKTCCKLYGLDGNGQVAMEYYVDVSGAAASSVRISNIYCVPGGFWEAGGTEDQIRLYDMKIRSGGLGVIYVHYPG